MSNQIITTALASGLQMYLSLRLLVGQWEIWLWWNPETIVIFGELVKLPWWDVKSEVVSAIADLIRVGKDKYTVRATGPGQRPNGCSWCREWRRVRQGRGTALEFSTKNPAILWCFQMLATAFLLTVSPWPFSFGPCLHSWSSLRAICSALEVKIPSGFARIGRACVTLRPVQHP